MKSQKAKTHIYTCTDNKKRKEKKRSKRKNSNFHLNHSIHEEKCNALSLFILCYFQLENQCIVFMTNKVLFDEIIITLYSEQKPPEQPFDDNIK